MCQHGHMKGLVTAPYLRTISTAITSHVSDDLRKVLGILDDIYVTQHLQVREVCSDRGHLKRRDEGMVSIQIGNNLESTVQ